MVKIYKLKFKGINKECYIGITTESLKHRKSRHIRDINKLDTLKTQWLKRYLDNKTLMIRALGRCGKLEAFEQEKYYIALYKEKGWKLFNSNIGGSGILKHSQETKDKISKANKGRKLTEATKCKIGEASTGRKMSKKTRQIISESLKGIKLSEEHKNKLKANHKGNTGKKFTDEHKRKISIANKGKILGPQPFSSIIKRRGINNKSSIKVEGTNIINNQKIYAESVGDAYRELNQKGIIISRASIYKCLAGTYKTAGGFQWKKVILKF